MEKRVVWSQLVIGGLALAVGVVLYLVDRPATQTYFVSEAFSQYDKSTLWFGMVGNYLPTFLHAFAFCVITVGVLGGGKKLAIKTCLFWLVIDGLFEIGQHAAVASVIVHYIPGWFARVPVLENTASYFIKGQYDTLDMLSILLGVVIAYAVTQWKGLSASPKPHE